LIIMETRIKTAVVLSSFPCGKGMLFVLDTRPYIF